MNITEIRAKRDKLESDLFYLVYQFTKETNVIPYDIIFDWMEGYEMNKKRRVNLQLINCVVKLVI